MAESVVLETPGTEVEAPVTPKDSEGKEIKLYDRVRVAEKLLDDVWGLEFGDKDPEARAFDFGEVDEILPDGIVKVWWDAAGCSCTSDEGRTENPSDLTLVTDAEELIYHRGLVLGRSEGTENVRSELRELLGISEPAAEPEQNDN